MKPLRFWSSAAGRWKRRLSLVILQVQFNGEDCINIHITGVERI